MNTKTKKTTILLLLILLVFGVALFYWHGLILEKKKDLIINKQNHAETIANSKNLDELNNNLAFSKEAIMFFEDLYIDSNKVIEFINFIEDLALSTNTELNIQTLNSSAENNSTFDSLGYDTIEISLNIRGSWDDINEFIIMLENVHYHIKINELKISKISSPEGNEIWMASLKFIGIAK